jgi:hypothetical protein
MLHVMLLPMLSVLYFYRSICQSICAVPCAIFHSFLISCLSDVLLRYFMHDLEIVPVPSYIIGITFIFAFYMHCFSFVRSLYFRIFMVLLLLLLLLSSTLLFLM